MQQVDQAAAVSVVLVPLLEVLKPLIINSEFHDGVADGAVRRAFPSHLLLAFHWSWGEETGDLDHRCRSRRDNGWKANDWRGGLNLRDWNGDGLLSP